MEVDRFDLCLMGSLGQHKNQPPDGPLSAPHRCQEEEARRCHLLMGCACRHRSRESAPGPALCSATALVWQRGAGSVINAVHQNLIAQPQLHRKQPKESGVTELLRENYSAVS